MNTKPPAGEFILISSAWVGLTAPATAQPQTAQARAMRGVGREYVHICIDDHARIAVTDICPDKKATSAIACLSASVACYLSLGFTVAHVMTDKGSYYKAKTFAAACKVLNLKHIRTKPYTPKTNGKAERFIQTALPDRPARPPCQNGPTCPIGTGLMAV